MQAYSMPCCGLVGGFGARAVSRKTPIYFILFTAVHRKLFQSYRQVRGAGCGLRGGRRLGHREMSRRRVSVPRWNNNNNNNNNNNQQQQQQTSTIINDSQILKTQDIQFQGPEGQKRSGADGLCCGSWQVLCLQRQRKRTVCGCQIQNWLKYKVESFATKLNAGATNGWMQDLMEEITLTRERWI